MSSRVQKGGQKFKPVAKARARTGETSRQLSTVRESQDTQSAIVNDINQAAFRVPSSAPEPSSSNAVQHETTIEFSRPSVQHSDEAEIDPAGSHTSVSKPLSKGTQGGVRSVDSDTVSIGQQRHGIPTIIAVGQSRSVPSIQPSRPVAIAGPLPENQEGVETLLSILQNLQAPGNSDSSHPGPPAPPPDPLSVREAPGTQTPSQEVLQSPDNYSLSAAAGPSETQPKAKPSRRPREKKSERNRPATSGTESQEATNAPKKKRRKSKLKELTDDACDERHDENQDNRKRKRSRARRSSTKQLTSDAEQDEQGEQLSDEDDTPPKARKKRVTSTSATRKRRTRAPSLPPFDADADPGEDLDPTTVTMAVICNDTGQGRVSSKAATIHQNYATWRQQNKEKRATMRMVHEAKKYGRKEDEGGSAVAPPNELQLTSEAGPSTASSSTNVDVEPSEDQDADGQDLTGSGFDYRKSMATSNYNVQIRIGPNGETIIDEESLVVDRGNDAALAEEEYTHVEESDQTKFVNSLSYSKKVRGSRWSAEETELFYDALSQFGENYELISYILPGRDRKSCKNKFKAEDKKNSERITYCLKNRIPYDMQTLARMTGKDFSGPTPEIRAPEILRLDDGPEEFVATSEAPEADTSRKQPRKRSRTPRAAEDGVEVVGDIDSFVDPDMVENETHASTR